MIKMQFNKGHFKRAVKNKAKGKTINLLDTEQIREKPT